MPKDKLLRINNNKKGDKKRVFNLKKKETKKSLYKPTRNSLLKLKRERIKKSLHKPARKKPFISKINEIKNFLFDSKLNGNRKKDKIKIIFYEPGKNLFKPEENYYKP